MTISPSELDLFDQQRSDRAKREGMQRAADNGRTSLENARRIARQIALTREDLCITADDVGRLVPDLGPAAGSLFKTDEWHWTGQFKKSSRVTNHSRLLRVWRLGYGE
jgi:inosine/xanthosine triphosphate pyrophosphatase family protein